MPKKFTIGLLTLMVGLTSIIFLFFQKFEVTALENNDGGDQILEIIDEAIKLDLSVVGQNYPDKDITLKIVIKSEINIARAQLAWIYNDSSFSSDNASNQIIELRAGEEQTIYKTFKIKRIYAFKESKPNSFGVKVTGSAYDRNYLSVRKVNANINADYEIVPYLSDYNQQKTIVTTIYWILGVIFAGVVIWFIVLGVKRFQKYLNSD